MDLQKHHIFRSAAAWLVFMVCHTVCDAATVPGNPDLTLSDSEQLLIVEKDAQGQPQYSLNLELFERKLAAVAVHARSYPPTFADAVEREQAIRMVQFLSGTVEQLKETFESTSDLATRAGFLYAMAYNLDLPEAFESNIAPSPEQTRAARYYQTALQHEPDNAEACWLFGIFLSSTDSAKNRAEGLVQLKRAVKLGSVPAMYSLGLAYLSVDEEQAIKWLEEYVKREPTDTAAPQILEAIRAGRAKTVKGHFDQQGKPIRENLP